MSDEWDFYPARVDDQPASIFLNLSVAKQGLAQEYPMLGYVRLRLLNARPDGLSAQDEYDRLIEIEDALSDALTEHELAIYVGRNTSSGNRDFYFYHAAREKFLSTANDAMAQFSEYEFFADTRDDPEWSTYFGFLHPSPRDMQIILNRRVCDQLAKNDDNHEIARDIDHRVVLKDEASLAAFKSFLSQENFRIENVNKEGFFKPTFTIDFVRSDKPVNINDVVLPLYDKVMEMGGEYDGWGCCIELQ